MFPLHAERVEGLGDVLVGVQYQPAGKGRAVAAVELAANEGAQLMGCWG
ncbi:MAG: hypothetical protein OXT09_23850 [Myxococcales bacterium]|nr:hypothetical protein [Myxococcales bacterium]